MSIPSSPQFKFSCSKHFPDYPCTHRQWRHPGHCHFVHGYSRSFTFYFGAVQLDKYGFVVDFSSLRDLEQELRNQFDHTFLINSDDPLRSDWERLDKEGALKLRVMENVGMESTSRLVWGWANELLLSRDKGRTCCWRTTTHENATNAASYLQIPSWFKTS